MICCRVTPIKTYKKILCIIIAVALLFLALFTAINRAVVWRAEFLGVFEQDDVDNIGEQRYDAIVVLGAGLKAGGEPSDMLADRLCGAIYLFNRGLSDTIILSGDRSGEHYDEVTSMENFCLSNGVPSEAIVRDDIGYSTRETMSNVIKTMNYDKIIVVTQRYHLYRAMYIAHSFGADVTGYASDYRTYKSQWVRNLREYLARAKDFFLVLA